MVQLRLAWEHTHRELLASILILRRLRDDGVVAHLQHARELAGQAEREVVLLPFYYDDSDLSKYLYRLDLSRRWVVNLAYEQMHFRCGRGYLMPDGRFAREQMLHCAWGPRFESLLVEHGIAPERIRRIRHPRFGIYGARTLLRGREALAADFGLDPGKRWILVPYNFNLAYIKPELRASLEARGYALSDEFLAGVATARDAFTPMVRTLADAYPDHEVILRVHPAGYEAATLYEAEGRARPNLHVIADYDVAEWICACALVIVWNSTTSMEAVLAGTPVIAYEPEAFSERFEYDVNRIIPTFSAVDDILSVVSRLPNPGLTYDLERFAQWYGEGPESPADRIAAIVHEARADFDSFRVRDTSSVSAGDKRRRRNEQLFAHLPAWLRPGPKPRRVPPPEAIARAVADLRSDTLLEYLR
jgi:surface carbohydrate biosynthesis protein